MMGQQDGYQQKLFITGFNLDKRIPDNHILRKISETVDFDFIYKEVKHTYGLKGNVLVPPPVICDLPYVVSLVKSLKRQTLLIFLLAAQNNYKKQ